MCAISCQRRCTAPRPNKTGLQHPAPLEHYRDLVRGGAVLQDAHQLRAVEVLDRLWHDLQNARSSRLLGRLRRDTSGPERGLYLWGSVGRGKTYIIDTFFDCVRKTPKKRIHFHSFMRGVHADLKSRPQAENPLALIARQWASEFQLLCLDAQCSQRPRRPAAGQREQQVAVGAVSVQCVERSRRRPTPQARGQVGQPTARRLGLEDLAAGKCIRPVPGRARQRRALETLQVIEQSAQRRCAAREQCARR